MNMDRQILAGFWLVVTAILEAAEQVLGRDSSIFSIRMHQTAQRFFRMAKFMVQRLCVMEALYRLKQGEKYPEHIVPPGVFQPTHSVPRPKAPPKTNAPAINDHPVYAPKIALIEPFFTPTSPRKNAANRPARRDPYAQAAEGAHYKLRLKLEALQAAIKQRDARVETLMAWFSARRDDGANPIPWRYGHTPFQKHRRFGETVCKLTQKADALLDGFIQLQCAQPEDSAAQSP